MSKEQRFDIHQHITNQIVGHPDRPNPENTFTNHPRPRTSYSSQKSLFCQPPYASAKSLPRPCSAPVLLFKNSTA